MAHLVLRDGGEMRASSEARTASNLFALKGDLKASFGDALTVFLGVVALRAFLGDDLPGDIVSFTLTRDSSSV